MRWRRLVPMARLMPISGRRSAASITKIRKISSTPTITLKRPNTRKTVVKMLAMLSACLMPSCLAGYRCEGSARGGGLEGGHGGTGPGLTLLYAPTVGDEDRGELAFQPGGGLHDRQRSGHLRPCPCQPAVRREYLPP